MIGITDPSLYLHHLLPPTRSVSLQFQI